MAIAEDLRHHDIELELLTGPLQGVYAPSGHGGAPFAFFVDMADYARALRAPPYRRSPESS